MSKPPAFQFYANDFMDATSMWEANAVGLYIRCLCKQWTHGSIPSDLRVLARAVHMDLPELEQCWQVVGSKFVKQDDGSLKNSKLEVVRERQEHVSKVRSQAGIAGANAKANARDLLEAKAKQRKEKEKEKENTEGGGSALKKLFSNSKLTDIEAVKQALPELVAEGVNLEHYRDAIRNWSDTKDERRSERGWIATFRQWTKTDRDKKELKMLGVVSNGWNPRG